MNNNNLSYWLSGAVTNLGANGRELLLAQAQDEYNKGNPLHSVFYQIRALYQTFQHRLFTRTAEAEHCIPVQTLVDNCNEKEKEELRTNPLLIAALAELRLHKPKISDSGSSTSIDFLQNISNAEQGLNKIVQACQQLPKEWTIVQLCKSSHSETTHAIYTQIHLQSAPIFLTILRHARSADYPLPVVVCIDKGEMQCKMFERQGKLANNFKKCINVDPATCSSRERRMHYWGLLCDFDEQIKETINDMQNLLFPWCFLLLGQPSSQKSGVYSALAFKSVDEFCAKHALTNEESRVLLSLAALHVQHLNAAAIKAISQYLLKSKTTQIAAEEMLVKLQLIAPKVGQQVETFAHFPCILIVDERLDHFFWEETFVQQEYTRVNSLHCLLHLYEAHKQRIKKGYLQLKINSGACIVNPDKNLPKTEMRMKSFMQYWRPQWQLKCGEAVEQDELFNKFFKSDCYVYAGHGSGLQYINGKYIAEQRIESVVFLFGCDSTRMYSQGLYSELIGPHIFYQAALCPTFVGTLMPALDLYMDLVAAQILSHWITPHRKSTLSWSKIERTAWSKQGLIRADTSAQELQQTASLCSVLAYVHQRHTEKKYYNTVQFVCRGLPAWNCNVES